MHFYQHLVDVKAITSEQLLDVLEQRLQKAPSLARVAYEHEVISDTELQQILNDQQTNQISFLEAFNSFTGNDQKRLEALKIAAVKSEPSVIRLLLDQEIISVPELVSNLDEYLAKLTKEMQK